MEGNTYSLRLCVWNLVHSAKHSTAANVEQFAELDAK
jgi:hypothetical protein